MAINNLRYFIFKLIGIKTRLGINYRTGFIKHINGGEQAYAVIGQNPGRR